MVGNIHLISFPVFVQVAVKRYTDYFKKHNCVAARGENSPDVVLGIKLTLDSLGIFEPEILFSNISDENFKGLVLSQIQTYWRYPRSEQGNLEVWVPVVWKSCYRHNSN